MERRNFIRNSTLGLGAGIALTPSSVFSASNVSGEPLASKLPREVWIATLTLTKIDAANYQDMVEEVLGHMADIVNYKPDVICLPEIFPFFHISEKISIAEVAEQPLGKITSRFAEFARKHKTYIICPLYTVENGRYYNAAVVIDREGKVLGEYRKTHTTEGEMGKGITPGPLEPPVFKTDFGIIGVQICFDLEWNDGWEQLKEKGAEIVFFPSAYSGGKAINTRAWQNKYCVVSSTLNGTAKICDVTGEEIAKTGFWDKYWAIAPLNLEKAFLHTWPYVRKFKDIHAKYGRKVKITNFSEEEWSIIESLSPEVKIADILEEFDLKTHKDHIQSATDMQRKLRKG
ncbi:carbon-nitrogen hydrolase family protein [Maribacter polysiphoniae]|uniref:Carbon-nitrogen hydrolase family protein n=1 Tax=Maribacter polysiphoniae TaxID=429344 RepID=A0A316DYY6_9FLAO|nr:carbon-nitrogen hydrolase family protein [Maribacter polysiphoniae]MBD1261664.1 carbon-nitrogen hydrolase family protein [Maribacter polysiphoniae]PWK22532.1 putative amidohydrolase [Maribacter polysiphoniae]